MQELTLTLPLPPEILHPNGRTRNRGYLAAKVRESRATAKLIADAEFDDVPFCKATIEATFYIPRKRDDDGLNAWLKSYRDGLADAGLVVNDSCFTMLPPKQVTGKKAGRKVVLTIREAK